ncbi:hypothetical protein K402DRAFT_466392 [Aulographum hederae CBS 113979]|uniref:Trafficking protein particle complex subunit 11 domain-containing protein n=1 Tax=Aulographum hederae CBS 113979 TaxID=1176131 RepID=A0A6G1GQ40_9PEZI|nr:hypothetical protein K402DRAFT_466392 [Aulographum hederae CBS 113979]
MEAYPDEYVDHNLPLIVLSGLEHVPGEEPSVSNRQLLEHHGPKISSELPLVQGERAQQLLGEFFAADGSQTPWNNKPNRIKGGLLGFKFRAVGREFSLPRRKAEPPTPVSPSLAPSGTSSPGAPPSWVLHSPISPLSPGSPVFPDGVTTPLWIAKHQHYIPSILISFFNFTSDPSRNSLHDNQLKSEINAIKATLQMSDYKTRHVVILLSDKTILEPPDIEDRLSNIRRATGLDPKTSMFFLPPDCSRVEVAAFVTSILTTLQPICVEYYRDLTKHTRRKKNRGHIPPPTAPPTRGTSQTLGAQGWGVRYEFKLGVFAEFRQEMDAAGRHYTFAFDALLGQDGIFETTPIWSPRWDETRLLADAIALRIIRCLLWNGLTTQAVQSWTNYRDRMRELVDRRGKGSSNYGWEAWETRWAKIMAELVHRADLPIFGITKSVDVESAIYAPPEKAIPVGERLPPWQLLHHPGYWSKLAAVHAKTRRSLAEEIPEDDRTPPGRSPASAVASRHGTYDTYLCPEPHVEMPLPDHEGFDHSAEIVDLMNESVAEFHARGQHRAVEKLNLELGKDLVKQKKYSEAFTILKPVWEGTKWREEKWPYLLFEIARNLYECARELPDVPTLVATQWELLSSTLRKDPTLPYDLMKCAASISPSEDSEPKPQVQLKEGAVTSFLSTSFIFAELEGHVGEPLPAQLVLTSNAQVGSSPVTLSKLKVQLDGSLRVIELEHKADEGSTTSKGKVTIIPVAVRESHDTSSPRSSYSGETELTISAGETKVFSFSLIFRESGPVNVINSTITIETEQFEVQYTGSSVVDPTLIWYPWFVEGSKGPRSKRLRAGEELLLNVLPKPPKMEIHLPNYRDQYYTDETITLQIELSNQEEDATSAVLSARFKGRSRTVPQISWGPPATSEAPPQLPTLSSPVEVEAEASPIRQPTHPVGTIPAGNSQTTSLSFTAPWDSSDHVLEIKVLYHTLSDPETPISKTLITDVVFIAPFEVNYSFLPRFHPEPWPSYFSPENVDVLDSAEAEANSSPLTPKGIVQRWHLGARIESFADESLVLLSAGIEVQGVVGGVFCDIAKSEDIDAKGDGKEIEILPRTPLNRAFVLETRKGSLDDRRAAHLDLTLRLEWGRKDGITLPSSDDGAQEVSDGRIRTALSIPRLTLPQPEPRVLLSSSPFPPSNPSSSSSTTTTIPSTHLTYTIENPTLHFLTFELSMEISETFAFSGPKFKTVNVLPVSRRGVRFVVTPLGLAGGRRGDGGVAGEGEGGGGKDGKDGVAAEGQGGGEMGILLKPVLRVVDRYFGKELRVLAAGEGVGMEKGGGVSVWVPVPSGREE